MKYLYIIFLLCLGISYACNEESGSSSVDGQTRCFTAQDVSESDCPAEQLTNMCTTYSCHFTLRDIVADGPFPPCPGDINSCEFIDCTTLMCGGSLNFNISASENGLGYSFDSIDSEGMPIEVNVTCNTGSLFNFTCGEEGTIFN